MQSRTPVTRHGFSPLRMCGIILLLLSRLLTALAAAMAPTECWELPIV